MPCYSVQTKCYSMVYQTSLSINNCGSSNAVGKLANIEHTLQGEIEKFGYAIPNRRLKQPTNFLPKGLPDLRPPQVMPTG
ncbi:MAG: hypothetical protein JEZ07_12445 [Phycisphaerae bacterium]|nr:hypothetical protein [Phycisphaerae bacterium]